MAAISISGKTLGAQALESFCPDCFWIKMRCDNKLPYQFFPSIFNSIDSYSKRITNPQYRRAAALPKWLHTFDDLVKQVTTPHFSKFFVTDPETNIRLTGQVDEIFQRKDGSYFIVDYKRPNTQTCKLNYCRFTRSD